MAGELDFAHTYYDADYHGYSDRNCYANRYNHRHSYNHYDEHRNRDTYSYSYSYRFEHTGARGDACNLANGESHANASPEGRCDA